MLAVVPPVPMLMLPVTALAETFPPLLVTGAFCVRSSPAVSAMLAPVPVVLTGPANVRLSPVPGVAPAVRTTLPPAETPALPIVSGLLATSDTVDPVVVVDCVPPGALTSPLVLRAPVLVTEIPPPLFRMPVMFRTPVFTKAMFPLVLLFAPNAESWLPALVRVVPVAELVVRDEPMIAPLCAMLPGVLKVTLPPPV